MWQFPAEHKRQKQPIFLLLLPKKMLKAQLAQPGISFFAARSVGRPQFFVNYGRCLPLSLFLQQARRVESRFVKPKEFRRFVGRRIKLENAVEGGQRTVAIRALFEANAFLE